MSQWSCNLCISFLLLLVHVECKLEVKEKVCVGSTGRMSMPTNREHHYLNLKDRYTNCTYVDGNLEITWLQDENLDLSFLQNIREVSGYVLISLVDVNRVVLPKLQIIRGRPLYKLFRGEEEFALIVTLSRMNTLEFPALRDIFQGHVGFFNNYNLCYTDTIIWDELLSGLDASIVNVHNITNPKPKCPPCHKSCEHGCWGEGPENCQKFSKINCSPQCNGGRCFGKNSRECCHPFCAGGCVGPTQNDCLGCLNVNDDGVCVLECPPIQFYNTVKHTWDRNPNGKYVYGTTCIKACPTHLVKDGETCVKYCPAYKTYVDGECVPCDGLCPKVCKGAVIDDSNIDLFENCTAIEGTISILETAFKEGYQKAIHPDRLKVFSTLKKITGFLNIQGNHEAFTNLSYFKNLEVIGGRELTPPFSASLYIAKTSLNFLGLKSLREINSGTVAIVENEHLCYIEKINWKKFKRSKEHFPMLQNNKPYNQCKNESKVCHPECSEEHGCWGPGPNQCSSL